MRSINSGILGHDQTQTQWSEVEEESSFRRASSVKSSLSQEPELQCSQSLSQIVGPSEEKRERLSKAELSWDES